MKSLIGLLLALSLALPACSAENDAATTPQPTANVAARAPTQATGNSNQTPVMANNDNPVVAQAREPAQPVTAPAARADIVAGKHYTVLTPTQPTSSSPDKVEVAEIFMYSCTHCNDFEPFVNSYLQKKPSYVNFVRIPANFNPMARLHSKAYYMAETLGVLEKVHLQFFNEFHNKGNRLGNEKTIIKFFVDQGVPENEVTNAYNSFAVDTKVRQADNLARRYKISSVPTLVINGKYVTSASMTGSFDKLREVVAYLTALEASQL